VCCCIAAPRPITFIYKQRRTLLIKALGHYYENIVELADKYAESYQGHYGIIPLDDYPDGFKVQKRMRWHTPRAC
jgi:hypothetical protein